MPKNRPVLRPLSLPSSSTTNSFVDIQYSRGSSFNQSIHYNNTVSKTTHRFRSGQLPQCDHNPCGKYYMHIVINKSTYFWCTIATHRGHCGQGLSLPREAGGCGKSSKFVTDLAPCRIAVPIQSLPVSPPPITITSLPFALM